MSDLERSGVELVAETSDFSKNMGTASNELSGFGDLAVSVGTTGLDALSGGVDAVAGAISGAFTAAIGLGVAGLAALAAGIGAGIGEAIEAEPVINDINRQIRNLGEEAPLTSSEVFALSEEFAGLAKGSDDAVLAIIQLGLRSQNISEDEFPSFIQASLDLGAVMKDNTKAANILAKAQDDPLAAYKQVEKATGAYNTALEEQIKAAQEAGDTAGALDLFMGALADTTGGAAAEATTTIAGTMELLKNSLSEAGETVGTVFLPMIHEIADFAVANLIPAMNTLAEGAAAFFEILLTSGDIGGAFDALGEFVGNVFPGTQDAFYQLGAAIEGMVEFIQANIPAMQETLNAAWASIQPALQILSDTLVNVLMPAIGQAFEIIFGQAPTAQATMDALLAGIVAGAQMAADWVTTVLVPAVQQFSTWIVTDFAPAVVNMNDWLAVNIPLAIQGLSDFWNNVLMPAVTATTDFWNGTLVPTFITIADWLAVTIPAAIQGLADFWNNVLMPAVTALNDYWTGTLLPTFTSLYDFINTSIVPVLTSLGDVFTEVGRIVSEVFVLVWNEVLQPALQAVSDFITNTVSPALTDLGRVISDTISPAVTSFQSNAIDPLASAFGTLGDALAGVKGWLDSVADALANIHIPSDLTPGSPTPFEIGMRGISAALADVTTKMTALDAVNSALEPIGLMGGAGAGVGGVGRTGMLPVGAGGVTTNNTVTQYISYPRAGGAGNAYNDMRAGLNAARA